MFELNGAFSEFGETDKPLVSFRFPTFGEYLTSFHHALYGKPVDQCSCVSLSRVDRRNFCITEINDGSRPAETHFRDRRGEFTRCRMQRDTQRYAVDIDALMAKKSACRNAAYRIRRINTIGKIVGGCDNSVFARYETQNNIQIAGTFDRSKNRGHVGQVPTIHGSLNTSRAI